MTATPAPATTRRPGRAGRALATALLLLASCTPSDEERAKAAAQRDALDRATPDTWAQLLRDHYGAERACLTDLQFPATVIVTVDTTAAGARATDHRRRYEVLHAVGLVEREEVRPGQAGWILPPAAHVDSGGRNRVVRYLLTARGLEGSEPVATADGSESRRLCYARRRLLSVDSVIVRRPSLQLGTIGVMGGSDAPARYGDGGAHVGHTLAFDSVATWVEEVAARDSGYDFLELAPELVVGPQVRWARLGMDANGALLLPPGSAMSATPPR